MQINFELKGKLLQAMKDIPGTVTTEIQKAVKDSSTVIQQEVKLKAPTSIGTLRKSIKRDLGLMSASIYPTVEYAKYVHGGSRPHWIPKRELAKGGSLYRWAKKKGLNPFAIAAGIARKGTKANPWIKEIFNRTNELIHPFFQKAVDNIISKMKG